MPVEFSLAAIASQTSLSVLLKALNECGSVSDLKFTDENKSTAYSKILFDPQQAQDLPKLEESLQAKFNGLFTIHIQAV